jgi:hypothetical protein
MSVKELVAGFRGIEMRSLANARAAAVNESLMLTRASHVEGNQGGCYNRERSARFKQWSSSLQSRISASISVK